MSSGSVGLHAVQMVACGMRYHGEIICLYYVAFMLIFVGPIFFFHFSILYIHWVISPWPGNASASSDAQHESAKLYGRASQTSERLFDVKTTTTPLMFGIWCIPFLRFLLILHRSSHSSVILLLLLSLLSWYLSAYPTPAVHVLHVRISVATLALGSPREDGIM